MRMRISKILATAMTTAPQRLERLSHSQSLPACTRTNKNGGHRHLLCNIHTYTTHLGAGHSVNVMTLFTLML